MQPRTKDAIAVALSAVDVLRERHVDQGASHAAVSILEGVDRLEPEVRKGGVLHQVQQPVDAAVRELLRHGWTAL